MIKSYGGTSAHFAEPVIEAVFSTSSNPGEVELQGPPPTADDPDEPIDLQDRFGLQLNATIPDFSSRDSPLMEQALRPDGHSNSVSQATVPPTASLGFTEASSSQRPSWVSQRGPGVLYGNPYSLETTTFLSNWGRPNRIGSPFHDETVIEDGSAPSNLTATTGSFQDRIILQPREADLVKVFTQTWGPIFDCFDAERNFSTRIVRVGLMQFPPILDAIMAISALQLSRISCYPPAIAEHYRKRCSAALVPILVSHDKAGNSEETLFATYVLLRGYAHMTGELNPSTRLVPEELSLWLQITWRIDSVIACLPPPSLLIPVQVHHHQRQML